MHFELGGYCHFYTENNATQLHEGRANATNAASLKLDSLLILLWRIECLTAFEINDCDMCLHEH